jgi:hypothetical protein
LTIILYLFGLGSQVAAFGALYKSKNVLSGPVDIGFGEFPVFKCVEKLFKAPFGRKGELDVAASLKRLDSRVEAAPVRDDGSMLKGSVGIPSELLYG